MSGRRGAQQNNANRPMRKAENAHTQKHSDFHLRLLLALLSYAVRFSRSRRSTPVRPEAPHHRAQTSRPQVLGPPAPPTGPDCHSSASVIQYLLAPPAGCEIQFPAGWHMGGKRPRRHFGPPCIVRGTFFRSPRWIRTPTYESLCLATPRTHPRDAPRTSSSYMPNEFATLRFSRGSASGARLVLSAARPAPCQDWRQFAARVFPVSGLDPDFVVETLRTGGGALRLPRQNENSRWSTTPVVIGSA